jgi:hypothetical protein
MSPSAQTHAPLSTKDRFRANTLPWIFLGVVAAIAAYLAFRSYRGLPDAANPAKGDFEHFYHAARAMMLGENIYASHTRGYIYPPLLAMLLRPLAGFDLRPAQLAWAGVNLAMVAATVWLSLRLAVTRLAMPSDRLTLSAVACVGVLIGFEPLRQEIEEGQTDTIVALALVGALAALDRRPLLAGVLIGLGANIKYQALVVVPYLVLRRRWAAAGSALASAAAFALVPAVVVGWERNLEYLSTAFGGVAKLLGMTPAGEIVKTHDIRWEKSISVTSGLAKTLGPGVPETIVLGLAMGVAIIVLGLAMAIYARRGTPLFAGRAAQTDACGVTHRVVPFEWAGLLVAVLAFSPQTLVRHMYILLPMFVWVAALLLVPRKGVGRVVILLGVVLFLSGMLLPPGNIEAFKPALASWRNLGGTGWCLLALFLATLWTGLEYVRAAQDHRPLLDPPPGYAE